MDWHPTTGEMWASEFGPAGGGFIKQGDTMLTELGVRFRDIRQGPDGYIHVLTEGRLLRPRDTDGILLHLEPVVSPDTGDESEGTLPEAGDRRPQKPFA